MIDYKKLKVGDKLLWDASDAIDGKHIVACKVSEVYEDHAIAEVDGMTLYIDKDNQYTFIINKKIIVN